MVDSLINFNLKPKCTLSKNFIVGLASGSVSKTLHSQCREHLGLSLVRELVPTAAKTQLSQINIFKNQLCRICSLIDDDEHSNCFLSSYLSHLL